MANAMSARGPLKKYYLVCRVPDWKIGVNKLKGTNPLGKLDKGDEDRILKLLAAYLIERNRKLKSNDDYIFEPINFSDIGFWQFAQGKTDSSKYRPYTYQRYDNNERRPLFKFDSSQSNNQAKAKPDEEWFEICGWELIEATENDYKLNEYLKDYPGAVFYSDPGASQYLRKNVRYERY
ncbi:MAG: hypothetical protein E7220_08585 [Clostridiales bacterium]|nr:hypothetical protein [Clostridiales bacterium]